MISINPMWKTFPVLYDELEKVEAIVQKSLRLRNSKIEKTLLALASNGGKLVRPAFVLLFSQFGNVHDTAIYKAAAAMETLHLATLIHDDVLDNSPLRRGVKTIHSQYGDRNAIYAGDFLFTIYFELINESARNSQDVHLNAISMRQILLGELDQMRFDFTTGMTIKDYLREIDGKTAALFQLSCDYGARISGADPKIQLYARRIGHFIGMAFQILDDILDYTQNSEALLKPVGEDIRSQTYSVPLIYAVYHYPKLQSLLQLAVTEPTPHLLDEIIALVKTYGVPDAKHLATAYTHKALAYIQWLPDNPAKDTLQQITRLLLSRTY